MSVIFLIIMFLFVLVISILLLLSSSLLLLFDTNKTITKQKQQKKHMYVPVSVKHICGTENGILYGKVRSCSPTLNTRPYTSIQCFTSAQDIRNFWTLLLHFFQSTMFVWPRTMTFLDCVFKQNGTYSEVHKPVEPVAQ